MGSRNQMDPYGGSTSLVDKVIGNAYNVVLAVYRNLAEIKYVVSHMESIVTLAKNLPDTSNVLVLSNMGGLGQTVFIDLPERVTVESMTSFSVLLVDAAGNGYQDGNGNFLFWFRNGKLVVKLMSDAPASMVGAEIRWNINYRIR